MEIVLLSDIRVCHQPCVSLNNRKICYEISEDKIVICEKTAGLRNGNFSSSNSAYGKVFVAAHYFSSKICLMKIDF